MKDRFDEAWEALAAEDRVLQAPENLERRVLDALPPAFAPGAATSQARSSRVHHAVFALAVSVVAAVMVWQPWRLQPPQAMPLASRAFVPVPLQPAVPAQPPLVPTPIDVDRDVALMDWVALYQDLPIILMLDAAESAAAEPLQLVRLRMPKDALQVLGIATLGPDLEGLVDVDLLVGEDGLPKTIRQVRVAQEE